MKSHFYKLVVLVLAYISSVGIAYSDSILFDNGEPQAIKFPNTIALSSFSGWHVYDDFTLVEDAVIDSITFSVFSRSASANISAQYRIMETLLPVGVQANSVGIQTHTPADRITTPNGLSFPWPSGQLYYGYDVTLQNLNIPLSAGGYILSLAVPNGGTLAGYSWTGGPDTANAPGLTCFRQRSGLGTSFDYCKSGHLSFKINGGSTDSDGDGVSDDYDLCPETISGAIVDDNGCSESQVDGDSDGICDPDAASEGPFICVGVDNCPIDANPGQDDNDSDNLGDVCDLDDDNDGYDDSFDNCPLEANPDQTDFDGDGQGDACDPDDDNDGVVDGSDICANTPLGMSVDPAKGCTIAQLCPCEGPLDATDKWRNHGKYVTCMVKTSETFVEMDLISNFEKGAIVSEAARSSCGVKKKE